MTKHSENTEPSNSTKPVLALGRLTAKKIIVWLNTEFNRLNISKYEVYAIERTFYSQSDYEAGACRLVIKFKNKNVDDDSIISHGTFNCYYRIMELQWYINNGYELFLKEAGRLGLMSQLELDLRKT